MILAPIYILTIVLLSPQRIHIGKWLEPWKLVPLDKCLQIYFLWKIRELWIFLFPNYIWVKKFIIGGTYLSFWKTCLLASPVILPFCSIFMFVVYIQIVLLNGGYISRWLVHLAYQNLNSDFQMQVIMYSNLNK